MPRSRAYPFTIPAPLALLVAAVICCAGHSPKAWAEEAPPVSAEPPPATRPEEPPPGLLETLEEFRKTVDQSIQEGAEAYRRASVAPVAAFTARFGGQWWIVRFLDGQRPIWIRGVLPGLDGVSDEAAARAAGRSLLDPVRQLLGRSGSFLDPPEMDGDPWTRIVIFRQVVDGIPVDGARLVFRFLIDYSPADRAREQWNLEIMDGTVEVGPIEGSVRLTATAAIAALRQAAEIVVPPDEPPELVIRRDPEGHWRPAWRVNVPRRFIYVDAEDGRTDSVDKTFRLW